MSQGTPIAPFTTTVTQVITSFTVSCRTLNLFNNASFIVDSLDEKNNLVSRQIVQITPEQYNSWNNNDDYIINLIATILGYTIVTPNPGSATQQLI
jgi:hypothetical protein